MSAQSIALWNALPMVPSEEHTMKRSRSELEQDDDDDDDISIVSRTPSPPPTDSMDVDGENLSKYDEYVRGTTREVITVETRIKPTNKGFAMLSKLGWAEGQPLGLSGDGRVDPIPFQIKRDLTGLGKINQDVRMIETTVSQRRGLDSERQQKETEEQRRAREDSVARRTALNSEISSTLKAFYCTLCDKQFKNVAQYDEHTNSYAHHHKARFKDMQANVRLVPKGEVDKRKEKERKREEKELRKIAAAAGIKMAKPPASAAVVSASADAVASGMEVDPKPTGFKKSGWASLSSATESSAPEPQSGFRRSGWATVGSSSLDAQVTHEPSRTSGGSAPPIHSVGSTAPSNNDPNHRPSAAPAFRTAGWTSLDTGSSQPFPPPSAPPPAPAETPTLPTSRGWATASPSPMGGRGTITTPSPHGSLNNPPLPPSTSSPPIPISSAQPSHPQSTPPVPAPAAQPVRSGWQQFQKSGPKRR